MQKEPGVQVTALIIIACLFGGGGVAYGLANLVVQLAALFLLALNGNAVWQLLRRSPSLLAVPIVASLALPLLQLVPLPPSMWTTLPGREQLVESLAAVGPHGWRPATVSTARTFVAFLGLIAPFTVIALGLAARKSALDVATQAFIAVGVAGVLFGAVQVLGGNETAVLYPETTAAGVLTGFFANRNSTALFMVCCLLLLCGRTAGKPLSARWIATFSAVLLLTVGVVLTQSAPDWSCWHCRSGSHC
jgi:exopolysaccharide production protein ExoQ